MACAPLECLLLGLPVGTSHSTLLTWGRREGHASMPAAHLFSARCHCCCQLSRALLQAGCSRLADVLQRVLIHAPCTKQHAPTPSINSLHTYIGLPHTCSCAQALSPDTVMSAAADPCGMSRAVMLPCSTEPSLVCTAGVHGRYAQASSAGGSPRPPPPSPPLPPPNASTTRPPWSSSKR